MAKGKPFRAKHEAAHGVVNDALGETVLWIDTSQCRMDWSEKALVILNLKWQKSDRANRQWRQKAWDLVTGLVAGSLIEREVNPNALTVAMSMEKTGFRASSLKTDREKVAVILGRLDRCDLAEITKAEARALEIVDAHRARLEAIYEGIMSHPRLEGEPLKAALRV